jgi:hypothetical protein
LWLFNIFFPLLFFFLIIIIIIPTASCCHFNFTSYFSILFCATHTFCAYFLTLKACYCQMAQKIVSVFV